MKVADFKSRFPNVLYTKPAPCNQQLITSFVQDRSARGLSPSTCKFYKGYLTRFVDEIGQPLLVLDKDDIAYCLAGLPCSPGGKHAYLRVLRAFYSWAEDHGLVRFNPCSKVRIKVPKPVRPSVKVIDFPRLLDGCSTMRDKLVVAMLADTGLRLSELASILTSEIDPESQTIRVWGKGAKQRVVRYGPLTGQLLDLWLDVRSDTETLLGLRPRGISAMLTRLQTQTGIKCNAHAFRRTFACESVRNGLNLFYVQSLLGHSSLTMTRVYADQVSSEDAIKAYKPIVT